MAQQTLARASAREEGHSPDRSYFNPWRELCARLPQMVDEAHDARIEATNADATSRRRASHRGYYVASTILAYDHSEGQRIYHQNTSINSKPRLDSEGVCSERRLVDQIQRANRKGSSLEVVGLVVMGDQQPDQATGFNPETLWMCSERCWPRIIEPRKIATDALIITVRPNKHKTQIQTAGELDAFYAALVAGDRKREPITYDHDSQSWGEIVKRFDDLIPRNFDPFVDEVTQRRCVEAARAAIQGGYAPLRAA